MARLKEIGNGDRGPSRAGAIGDEERGLEKLARREIAERRDFARVSRVKLPSGETEADQESARVERGLGDLESLGRFDGRR
jgi:hypothetical protein